MDILNLLFLFVVASLQDAHSSTEDFLPTWRPYGTLELLHYKEVDNELIDGLFKNLSFNNKEVENKFRYNHLKFIRKINDRVP